MKLVLGFITSKEINKKYVYSGTFLVVFSWSLARQHFCMQWNLCRNKTGFFTEKDVTPGIQNKIYVGQAETQYLETLHSLKDAHGSIKHIDMKETANISQRKKTHDMKHIKYFLLIVSYIIIVNLSSLSTLYRYCL